MNSWIREGGDLTKEGTGTLRLANGANDFTGGVTLNSGQLQLGDSGVLGSGSLTINGGTLEGYDGNHTLTNDLILGGDFTVGNSDNRNLTFSGNGTVNAGNQSITVENGINFELSGDLSGSGGLTKSGTGTLVLGGGNDTDFFGGLTIDAGTVSVDEDNALTLGSDTANQNLLGTGDLTVNAGGTLSVNIGGSNDINGNGGGLPDQQRRFSDHRWLGRHFF